MDYKIRFKDFKKKSITFSFDDGTFYDVYLVELFNKYNLKGTFNINSEVFGAIMNLNFEEKTIFHNRISQEQAKILYRGHEVASHSCHHPLLTNQTREYLDREVKRDIENLSEIFGEEIVGFAYPGGPFDAYLNEYLKDKVLYARSVINTHSYEIEDSFIPLKPTVCILEKEFKKISMDYLKYESEDISSLYIWGHSYEFAFSDIKKNFEMVVKKISNRDDIYYGTNKEILKYVKDARALSFDGKKFINESVSDIYLEIAGEKIIVKAKDVLTL